MSMSDKDLLALLKTVQPHITALQPLSANATPNSKRRRNDLLDIAQQISKRIKRMSTDSTEGLIAQEKKDIVSVTRFKRILDCVGQDEVTVKQFVEIMTMKQNGLFVDVEDAALRRLFVGYEFMSRTEWEALLRVGRKATTAMVKCEKSKLFDEVGELEQRLVDRHVFLFKLDNEEFGKGYVSLISKQIENIKFAGDWQELDQQPSGKRMKTQFFIASFQGERPQDFAHLSEAAKRIKMDELRIQFKAWKKKNDAVVYSRNRLRRMYLKFGVAVLTDPIWDVDNIVSHRSKTFTDVLTRLLAAIPSDEVSALSPLQDDNQHTLLPVLSILAGNDVSTHVAKFLHDNAPDIVKDADT